MLSPIGEHRGTSYSLDIVNGALGLLEAKKKYPENRNFSYSNIARLVGVQSHQTIINWEQMPMDDVSIRLRRLNKGHKRICTGQDELIIAGWVLDSNKSHSPSTTRDLMEFVEKNFLIRLTRSWVSKFLSRQHFSPLSRKYRGAPQNC
jgi:transposase